MKLNAFKQHLFNHPLQPVGFVFDDGDFIPGHFHVTEVGHVAKNFIDCGGTVRSVSSVQLQVWLGNDENHRLTAGKLANIIELAKPLIPSDELEVEVEYEDCVISQYTLDNASFANNQTVFRLADKHTDCLARESCGLEAAHAGAESSGCCGSSSRCC